MYSIPLNASDRDLYFQDLLGPHDLRVQMELLDLDQRFISQLSDNALSGQVDVDTTANETVDRRCNVNLVDRNGDVGLDTGNANDGAMFTDRMLRVAYGVRGPRLGRWVDIPIFTGPITSVNRQGRKVDVVAQGKEFFLLRPAWRILTIPAGTPKTTAIKRLLAAFGEDYVDIPDLNGKLSTPVQIGRETKPWPVLVSLADSLGYRLFYDGRGYASMTPLSSPCVWTFRGGDSGTIKSTPRLGYNMDEAANVVYVQGKSPEGKGTPVGFTAVAPASHPLSPQRLARSGAPTYLGRSEQVEEITTVAAAKKTAEAILQRSLLQAVDVDFESMPLPFLEPDDHVRVALETGTFDFTMRKFTLPFAADGSMSVGRRMLNKGIRR